MLVKDISEINPKAQNANLPWINYLDTSSSFDGQILSTTFLTGAYPSRAKRQLMENDILISSVRPENLHNCFVSLTKPNFVGSTGYIQIRVNDDRIVPKWLYYFLTTKKKTEFYSAIATSSQTTFPAFNSDVIGSLELPDISVANQRHIVDITSSHQ